MATAVTPKRPRAKRVPLEEREFTFKQLLRAEKRGTVDADAVERAREHLVHIVSQFFDEDDLEPTLSEWKDALEQIGFEEAAVWYDLGYCQGSGACFECASIDLDKLIDFLSTKREPSESPDVDDKGAYDWRRWLVGKARTVAFDQAFALLRGREMSAHVYRMGRDSHEYSCRVSLTDESEEPQNMHERVAAMQVEAFEKAAEQLRLSLAIALTKDLYEEYEYRQSDEDLVDRFEDEKFDYEGREI